MHVLQDIFIGDKSTTLNSGADQGQKITGGTLKKMKPKVDNFRKNWGHLKVKYCIV